MRFTYVYVCHCSVDLSLARVTLILCKTLALSVSTDHGFSLFIFTIDFGGVFMVGLGLDGHDTIRIHVHANVCMPIPRYALVGSTMVVERPLIRTRDLAGMVIGWRGDIFLRAWVALVCSDCTVVNGADWTTPSSAFSMLSPSIMIHANERCRQPRLTIPSFPRPPIIPMPVRHHHQKSTVMDLLNTLKSLGIHFIIHCFFPASKRQH